MTPRAIPMSQNNLPRELNGCDECQMERGQPRPIIDAVGWVVGIPSKLILWDRRAENHRISMETEAILAEYLASNELDQVKVRLNQYRPMDDWRRLRRNTAVAWPWRYTLGTLSVLGETIFPGRIVGGDHYNPYTGTIHIYSDIPAVALHEGAHAKDFARRDYPGTYAAIYLLPCAPLWHESIATREVLAYTDDLGDTRTKREAYHVLFPAYGTYSGSAAGYLLPVAATPLYYGSILAGHAAGRWQAHRDPSLTEHY